MQQDNTALATKLHFHLLLHSKLMHYAEQNMNESILCKIVWGKRSDMVQRLVNLSSVDVEQAVMEIADIKDIEVQTDLPLYIV